MEFSSNLRKMSQVWCLVTWYDIASDANDETLLALVESSNYPFDIASKGAQWVIHGHVQWESNRCCQSGYVQKDPSCFCYRHWCVLYVYCGILFRFFVKSGVTCFVSNIFSLFILFATCFFFLCSSFLCNQNEVIWTWINMSTMWNMLDGRIRRWNSSICAMRNLRSRRFGVVRCSIALCIWVVVLSFSICMVVDHGMGYQQVEVIEFCLGWIWLLVLMTLLLGHLFLSFWVWLWLQIWGCSWYLWRYNICWILYDNHMMRTASWLYCWI